MSAACRLCGGDPSAEIARSWSFRVERDAPSQNDIASNTTGHGSWAYRKERDAWASLFKHCRYELGIPPPCARRRVTITRCYSGRQKLRDVGNLIGGLKAAVDGLVIAGLLQDDSPKWAEFYYHQRRVPNEERGTLITIEEFA